MRYERLLLSARFEKHTDDVHDAEVMRQERYAMLLLIALRARGRASSADIAELAQDKDTRGHCRAREAAAASAALALRRVMPHTRATSEARWRAAYAADAAQEKSVTRYCRKTMLR